MGEKSIICSAIESKKQKVIKEYDAKINEILHEENPVNIYYLLAQTFHNTMEQGELGITFLKKILKNDFFKEVEIKNGVNYIIFSNEDFNVMFSKCLSREIKIEFKTAGSHSSFYARANPQMIKLADLTENYLNKRSFKNLKLLADYNCRGYKKNLIAKVFKYINTRKKCNKELVDKIRDYQEKDVILKERIEEENKEFQKRQTYAKEFIQSLTDLELFKSSGWCITTSGIQKKDGSISWV